MPDPELLTSSGDSQDRELKAHVEQALSGAYEVDRELGRGGMGIVYRARDRRLKRLVAIKLLPPELSFRRDIRTRFLREAETAAQLSHPNIVPIYSVDEVGNLVFFVMACVEGDNLAKQLEKRGPLPVGEVRRWLCEVADALAYAHGHGVVHRDIKPDNILVDAVNGRALVTDFGIARAAQEGGDASRLTATGMAIGTPTYMSPEQASGDRDIDGRTDLYALGVVAYQVLTGSPPFVGNTTAALMIKHLTEPPEPLERRRADIPVDLAAIVMRLLEKDPDNRFQSAADLAQSLRTGVVPPQAAAAATPTEGAPVFTSRGFAGTGRAAAEPYSPPAEVTHQGNLSFATYGDNERWEVPMVRAFRKQFAIYLYVNGAWVLLKLFAGVNLLTVSTVWTLYISYKYAKLWSEGYDWRDVLRQPHDRLFGDFMQDVGESIQAIFDKKKREEIKARGVHERLRGALTIRQLPRVPGRTPQGESAGRTLASGRVTGSVPSSNPMHGGASWRASVGTGTPPATPSSTELGPYAKAVQQARADRDEVMRLLNTMPPEERVRLGDVGRSASTLVEKMQVISADLARLERELRESAADGINAEIAQLESEANPFDIEGSNRRVRRLAILRRERRAADENARRIDARKSQLSSCSIALENIRLDLVRLRTGQGTTESVTLVAEQALKIAYEVEIAVAAAREVNEAIYGIPPGAEQVMSGSTTVPGTRSGSVDGKSPV